MDVGITSHVEKTETLIKCMFLFSSNLKSNDEAGDVAACSKRRVASEEDLLKDDLKKSRVEESNAEKTDGKSAEESESRAPQSEEVKVEAEEAVADSAVKEFTIGEAQAKKAALSQCPVKLNWY